MVHVDRSISAERVARNDAAFREANESIMGLAREAEMEGPLPVICECADLECTELLQVTRAEYREVRQDPRRFLTARGHEGAAGDWARVVAEHERYVVVEKVGEAGDVAEELAR